VSQKFNLFVKKLALKPKRGILLVVKRRMPVLEESVKPLYATKSKLAIKIWRDCGNG
jgi:hypothetical protein